MEIWPRRNLILLSIFAPLLVAAGALGFVLPPALSLMSSAPPYNFFHLAFGGFGLLLLALGNRRAMAAFNFGFGLIDLYQAVAGVLGIFPAAFFALRPADHVAHVLFGALLCAVGWRGLRGSAVAAVPAL